MAWETKTAAQVFLSTDTDDHMQVLAVIFSWLPSPRDVASCSCTGKRLRAIGCDAPLQLVISGDSARVRPAAGEECDRLRRRLQGIAAIYQGLSQHSSAARCLREHAIEAENGALQTAEDRHVTTALSPDMRAARQLS